MPLDHGFLWPRWMESFTIKSRRRSSRLVGLCGRTSGMSRERQLEASQDPNRSSTWPQTTPTPPGSGLGIGTGEISVSLVFFWGSGGFDFKSTCRYRDIKKSRRIRPRDACLGTFINRKSPPRNDSLPRNAAQLSQASRIFLTSSSRVPSPPLGFRFCAVGRTEGTCFWVWPTTSRRKFRVIKLSFWPRANFPPEEGRRWP